MEYFYLILLFGIAPSALFLFLARHHIHWGAFLWTLVGVFIIAFISDYIGIERKLWIYTVGVGKTSGITILNVPIEDLLFFLMIPPWIIGGYELLKSWSRKSN